MSEPLEPLDPPTLAESSLTRELPTRGARRLYRLEEARLLFVPGVLVLAAAAAFGVALLTMERPRPTPVVQASRSEIPTTSAVAPPQVPSSSPGLPTSSAVRSGVVSPTPRTAPSAGSGSVHGASSAPRSTSSSAKPRLVVVVAGYRPQASRAQKRAANSRAVSVAQRLLQAGWQVQVDPPSFTRQRTTTVFYQSFAQVQARQAAAALSGSLALRVRDGHLPGQGIFIVVLAR